MKLRMRMCRLVNVHWLSWIAAGGGEDEPTIDVRWCCDDLGSWDCCRRDKDANNIRLFNRNFSGYCSPREPPSQLLFATATAVIACTFSAPSILSLTQYTPKKACERVWERFYSFFLFLSFSSLPYEFNRSDRLQRWVILAVWPVTAPAGRLEFVWYLRQFFPSKVNSSSKLYLTNLILNFLFYFYTFKIFIFH